MDVDFDGGASRRRFLDCPNCQKDHEARRKKSSMIERHWVSPPLTCFCHLSSKASTPDFRARQFTIAGLGEPLSFGASGSNVLVQGK